MSARAPMRAACSGVDTSITSSVTSQVVPKLNPLAARAREECAPIRWDVMKERYLRMIEDVVNPWDRTAERPRVAEARVCDDKRSIEAPPTLIR